MPAVRNLFYDESSTAEAQQRLFFMAKMRRGLQVNPANELIARPSRLSRLESCQSIEIKRNGNTKTRGKRRADY